MKQPYKKYGDTTITFRLFPIIKKRIQAVLRADKGDRYDNESHFCRVAIIKLLREEEQKR